MTGLAEALPPGMYTGAGVEKYIREILADADLTNDFRMLESELYLTATDLDTCERVVFGAARLGRRADLEGGLGLGRAADGLPARSRSRAASSSTAASARRPTSTSRSSAARKFIVVVNPLVPYVNDFQKRIPTIFGSRVRRVSDMGYPQVGYQAFKLLAHARLHEHVKRWSERYPGVDIILIEPDPNDELMFGTSIMNYSSRIEIARHGFESVTLKLAKDYHATSASARSTASRSRRAASRRSCGRPRSSARRRPPGGASSSRRPARCCVSRKRARSRTAPRRRYRGRTRQDGREYLVWDACTPARLR